MPIKRPILLAVLISVGLISLVTSVVQAQDAAIPAIVALKVQGTIEFTRPEWTVHQTLAVGTLVRPTDLIFPQKATLLVLCPDGSTHEFLPSDLIPNTSIRCPANASAYVVGSTGTKRLNIRRGGRQDPAIPYLISPRATIIRSPQVELVWNAVPNVQSYSVTVRGGGDTWTSGDLDPNKVVQSGTASFAMDKPIQEKTAYTVEICVVFKNTNRHCTTAPDWSAGDNLAFYYVQTPALDKVVDRLTADLGQDNMEALYGQAVLLGQPFYKVSGDTLLGANSEAIRLLEKLVKDDPKSELVKSPELYNLLGDLYRAVSLPLSAARAYKRAADLAKDGTEAAAKAALGEAVNSPDGDATIKLYNAALDQYAKFLTQDAFKQQLTDLCKQIGDVSFDIERCAEVSGS